MIHFHDIEQGSNEWMALRAGSLGASSIADALAGGTCATRNKLMYRLAAERITGAKEPSFQSAVMTEGIRREPEARSFFEFQTGIQLEQTGLITNDSFPGMHCSPDGFNRDLRCGFEVKNPTAAVHVEYLIKGVLPAKYKKQVMFSLMLTGYESWWFMSYVPKLKPLIVEVKPEPKFIDQMAEKALLFTMDIENIKRKIQ